jgi:UDP:flavonoid glycosyltransferase YjiC (YdhE family)
VRVLFTSPAAHGHVQPIVPLAVAARDAGHEVTWSTGTDACTLLDPFGIRTEPAGLTQAERMAVYADRYPEAAGLTGEARAEFMFPHLFGAIAAPAMIDRLLEVGRSWRPDVIVHDAAEFAAPAVAAALGIPHAVHAFGFAVPPHRVAKAAELARPAWERVGLEPPPYGGCFDHLYIDIYPPSLQPPELLAHVGRRIGRRPASGDAAPGDVLPDRVRARLDGDGRRRVAYLTFGTVFNVHDTFARAVRALAANELDLAVVVTVGPAGDVEAFGPLPDRVVVERYVPQSLLLPHVDVVVSHGGSGTLLATMARGLPQLCLPQAADQFRNATACASAGAGLQLAGDAASEEAITAAVRRLLDEASFRDGASRLAAEISAMPDAAAVVVELERLASGA